MKAKRNTLESSLKDWHAYHQQVLAVERDEGRPLRAHQAFRKVNKFSSTAKNKVAVFTSRDVMGWTSMRDIFPFLEALWCSLQNENLEIRLINMDDPKSLDHHRDFLSHCRHITFLTSDIRATGVLRQLRGRYDFVAIFYLFHQAAQLLAPLLADRNTELFRQNDIFMVPCESDKRLVKTIFPKAFVKVANIWHPTLDEINNENRNGKRSVVFAGRISEQKNLISALEAVKDLRPLFIKQKVKFHIFGWEDGLGFPHLGVGPTNYGLKLREYIARENLSSLVELHGKWDSKKFFKVIDPTQALFLNLSSHVDENYGVAVRKFLFAGSKALVSDWGGHRELKNDFKSQVSTVKVRLTDSGPIPDANLAAKELKKWLLSPRTKSKNTAYKSFLDRDRNLLLGLLKGQKPSKENLDVSTLSYAVLKQHLSLRVKKFTFAGIHGAIFKGWNDPLLKIVTRAYGSRGGEDVDVR